MPALDANGLKIEYVDEGERSAPVILLVMGLAMQLTAWPRAFCDALIAAGFRVVRFDNRDIGLTTYLDHLGVPNIGRAYFRYRLRLPLACPYHLDDLATDTLGVLDALAIARAHVVGVSMGGMVAQNLAARHPERVASLVSIMSSSGSRALPQPTLRALLAVLAPRPKRGNVEAATQRLMNLFRTIGSRPPFADSESDLRAFCHLQASRADHPAGVARQILAIAASGDRSALIRRIRVPTLILHGRADPLVRVAAAHDLAGLIPGARLKVIEHMGHDLPQPLVARLAGEIGDFCRGRA